MSTAQASTSVGSQNSVQGATLPHNATGPSMRTFDDMLSKQIQPGNPSSAVTVAAKETKTVSDSNQVRLAVMQAVSEQQALANTNQQQLQSQVIGMSQLLRAQAAGIMQQQQQMMELQAEVAAQATAKPELRAQLIKMQQHQGAMGQLHQCMLGQLSKLQQVQMQVQQRALMQTQGHIGGLFKLLQVQGDQLQNTQAQVAELQTFAGQAYRQVQLLAKSHETDHRRLSCFEAQLQEQVSSSSQQGRRPSSRHSDAAEKKSSGSSRPQSVMVAAGAALMGSSTGSGKSGSNPKRSSADVHHTDNSSMFALQAGVFHSEVDKQSRKARIAELREELSHLHTLDASSDEEYV